LRDPRYKGEGFYNRTGAVDAHRPKGTHGFKDQRPGNRRSCRVRPREDWIPVAVPVMSDPETGDLAQEQLQRNRQRATRHNTRHAYLLRGLAMCGQCGRRMIGSWQPTGGRSVCSARSPRFAPHHCQGRSVMAAPLDERVWEYVKGLLADPALLRLRYAEGYADPAVQDQDEQERERIERKLEAQQREIQRLIDAYPASVIDLADLAQRRQRVEAHGHHVRERLQELQWHRTHREHEVRLLQGVEAFCASLHQALADPTFAVKQQVLQLVVDRIVVEEEQIVVHHIIPTGPFRLQTERKWNENSE
jgi:site-specific DNA recombinase